jgi:hypothetical protein
LSANPLRALIVKHGVPEWVEQLALAPELAGYVDGEALLAMMSAPEKGANWVFMRAFRPLSLAYWLRHRRAAE